MKTDKVDFEAQIKSLTFSTTLLFALVISFPIAEMAFRHIVYKSYTNLAFLISSVLHFSLIYLITGWLYLGETRNYFRKFSLQPLELQRPEKFNLIAGWIKNNVWKPTSIYFFPSDRINAFAFGTRNHRYIAISSKALDELSDNELRVLVFHEFSHHVFGDVWKFEFARYLTIVYVIFEVITSINELITSVQMGQTGMSELLRWLPDLIGLFPFVVMGLGVLAIIRLRELVADSFALLQTNDPNSFRELFIKISINRLSTPIRASRFSLIRRLPPSQFSFHPNPNSRLSIINDPNSGFNETYLLAAYVGLILGAFTGIPGDTAVLILFSLPIISIFGSIFLLYILIPLGLEKHHIKEAFALTGTAAFVSTFLTLLWRIGLKSNPLELTSVLNFSRSEYFFSPWLRFMSEGSKILDNHLLILTAGSLFIIIFLRLAANCADILERFFPRLTSPKILSGWVILVIMSIPVVILWVYLFGAYMSYAISPIG